jgi:hypothetical protein
LYNDAHIIETIASDDRIINECGAVGGVEIGSGNRNIGRKLAQVPLHKYYFLASAICNLLVEEPFEIQRGSFLLHLHTFVFRLSH